MYSVKIGANQSDPFLPRIYIITPTYSRPVQKAELTRLSHTLLLVPKIHWILVEDAAEKSALVSAFISNLLSFAKSIGHDLEVTHLKIPTPSNYKLKSSDPSWLKPRGVVQRNEALKWLRENDHNLDKSGVVYFADDDNTYDLRLFEEMRYTQKVSVWPVALVGGLYVERPLVSGGKVKGWNTVWRPERAFPIDMAGFAVNLKLILDRRKANFILDVPRGYQESFFLKQLLRGVHELEPKADDCSKVYVWHTRTEQPKLRHEKHLKVPSNDGIEI
ncbi:Galactosylgalactosylxylosylprotein 3-beta-glucuronosyltransferase 3-like protein [Dinothrombium tinctorium]|uniref:Galactosylgalactosylxylosylprotein 3-beta-glucuronosyltransferase n=1 Tax=Dinothrombium tinctorium TaxID=1965070 RepID=A0A3S4RA61_9ACAR|nr:Galactosylgalactosylxylosylprotein 3-beta-glucuronosyltransferase 3-like protein [Dinothrombium tinctorium]RWS13444.1 Galactosylgalactosylxylosylprotein 3-beta-glucuronosyltransferase 3-like protein [Dinothrombium tinctorium]RWS13589.1 Galactosylgalactosylxylosylprotein 3-beta-glucuronosyltransferase 3-like protein [Dinothrombium tinctorium]